MPDHIPQPREEGDESDNDEHLIPERRHCIHDLENKLKEAGDCIPETCPHSQVFFVGAKI